MKTKTISSVLLAVGLALGLLMPSGLLAQTFPSNDTTPPWVTRWAVTNITNFSATINWTTDEPATGQVEFCTSWVHCGNYTPLVGSFTTDHTINLSGLVPGTRYYFWIYSRDQFQNLRTYGYWTFSTPGTTATPAPTPTPFITPAPTPTPYPTQTPIPQPDTAPPWVMSWSVTGITPYAATVNWTTNEPATGQVEFCTSWNHCGNYSPLVSSYTAGHVINLSGLNPGTRYYIWMYSRDAAGNLRTYGYFSFTTYWVLPTGTPTPLPTPQPSQTPWPTPYPTQTPVPLPDTTMPWVTSWSVTNIGTSVATINWNTNEPADARVEFCTSWVNCGNFTPLVPSLTLQHQINLSGLNSNTRYYFWIYTRDSAGNLRIYGYNTFSTLWAGPTGTPTPLPTPVPSSSPTPTPYPSQTPIVQADVTPPWVMRWTVSNITTSSARVDWITDEVADTRVEFCTIWMNCGNFTALNPAFTTSHTADITGLNPGTRYYFWLYSRDPAGNLRIYGYNTFNTAWVQ